MKVDERFFTDSPDEGWLRSHSGGFAEDALDDISFVLAERHLAIIVVIVGHVVGIHKGHFFRR